MEVLRDFGVAFEPVIVGVLRSAVTLQGTRETMAPGFDLLGEAQTYARDLVLQSRTPSRAATFLRDRLLTLLPALLQLPRRLASRRPSSATTSRSGFDCSHATEIAAPFAVSWRTSALGWWPPPRRPRSLVLLTSGAQPLPRVAPLSPLRAPGPLSPGLVLMLRIIVVALRDRSR